MRIALALVLTLLVLAPDPAAGSVRDDLRGRVRMVLGAYEYKPMLKIWKRWGLADVNDVLGEIALDPKEPPRIRRRAALSLAALPTTRTLGTLRALIANAHAPMSVRRQALISLARAFPTEVFGDVRRRLTEAAPPLREAAALAAIEVRDPRVETLLQTRLAADTHIAVRAAIERALRVRERRRKAVATKPSGPPGGRSLTPGERDGL